MDEFVPDEDDLIEFAADEACEVSWMEWRRSRYAEPITDENDLDLSGTAFADAWKAGREYEKFESEAKIERLESLLAKAIKLIEANEQSARFALELLK